MKDYVEKVKEIRRDKEAKCNCTQAVMLAFAEEMGVSEEKLKSMGTFFAVGMGEKYTCGAVTGGLAAMGAMEYSGKDFKAFMNDFKEKYESHQCEDLLKARAAGGATCDDLIEAVVEYLQNLQEQRENEGK